MIATLPSALQAEVSERNLFSRNLRSRLLTQAAAAFALIISLLALNGIQSYAQCRLGVSSYSSHCLILHSSGTVLTWGYNNSGQLGNGTRENVTSSSKVLKGQYPGTEFLGDDPANPVTAIAALYRHSLALTSDGLIYGWGANNFGELGDTVFGNHFTPNRVLKGEYEGITFLGDNPYNKIVALGGGNNVSAVLAADGMVYTFGRNDRGQLGNGTTANSLMPVRVKKGEYNGTTYLGDNPANRVIAIAGGAYHMMALTADGSVFAWGRNTTGQLGTGDTISSLIPVRVKKGDYNGTMYLGDNPANRVVAIAAGGNYIDNGSLDGGCSIALLADGTIMTWGGNVIQLLGDGTSVDRLTPVKVLKGEYPGTKYLGDDPANPVRSISGGGYETVALLADGSLYSWGNNLHGQLGINSRSESALPVRVLKGGYNGVVYLGDNLAHKVVAMTASERNVIVIVDGYEIYGWGDNHRWQLIDTTFIDQGTPVLVTDLSDANQPLVQLEFFRAALQQSVAHLQWRTLAEQRSAFFEIERKLPGSTWQKIGTKPGQGTSTSASDYAYDDDLGSVAEPGALVWYRLRHVATDNSVRYFDSVSVQFGTSGVAENRVTASSLAQNTPNPFSTSTMIQYQVPTHADVRLEIRDLMGNLVKTLVDHQQEAGIYRQQVDATDLASGVYCYRLSIGASSTMKWMIVAR